MSARTRINRPTTATPRNVGTRRFLHVSTNYDWRAKNPFHPASGAEFVKTYRGSTYWKSQA